MKFRIFILKDPEATKRGFNLKGIKVPLSTWVPVSLNEETIGLDNRPVDRGLYHDFWKIPADDLIRARPALAQHLKKLDFLLVPTVWCDVAPVEHWDEIWRG